jgi:TonB family protein
MNSVFTGLYANGETLRIEPVELRVEAGRLYLAGPGRSLDFSLADIRSSDRLGRVPRFLYLPNRGTVETGDHRAVDALVALQDRGHLSRLIHWLEARARVAATATVLLTLIALAAVYFGLPALAERAAYAVPATVELQAGRAALATFNRYLAPSQLGVAERRRVQALLDRLGRQQHVNRPLVIEFRSMGGKFPNAFALPGGIIVVSDELVKLAENDQELTAVLAHELGHVEHRHGLQSVLRNSAALLVVSTVTGDLSTVTSFAGAIPLTLLQRGYSREFEAEADDYAIHALRAAGIDPAFFASILGKLQAARPEGAQDFSYLSTHPSTADRLRRINPDGHLPVMPVAKATTPAAKSPRHEVAAFQLPAGTGVAKGLTEAGVSPRLLSRVTPLYPFEMSAANVEGKVTVEFVIDQDGNVRDAQVLRSTRQEFEAPAIAAILQWKFVPGELHGRKVATHAAQIIEFNLEDLPATPAPQPK